MNGKLCSFIFTQILSSINNYIRILLKNSMQQTTLTRNFVENKAYCQTPYCQVSLGIN